jgi:hypothetical protein
VQFAANIELLCIRILTNGKDSGLDEFEKEMKGYF